MEVLKEIEKNRHDFVELLLEEASEYIYRNIRYNIEFSLIAIYDMTTIPIDFDTLKKMLRKTDKIVYINDNLFCVIADSVQNNNSVKVAENINYNLIRLGTHEDYFISVVSSEDYTDNYSKMIYELFSRLEDAIKNNLKNIVVCQDYVI